MNIDHLLRKHASSRERQQGQRSNHAFHTFHHLLELRDYFAQQLLMHTPCQDVHSRWAPEKWLVLAIGGDREIVARRLNRQETDNRQKTAGFSRRRDPIPASGSAMSCA